MNNLGKVTTKQLYYLWKNLTVSLLAIVVTICISKILPYYLAPVIALTIGAALYFYIYNTKTGNTTCVLPCMTILYCIIGYAFVTIILNLIHIWGVWDLPPEFVFFTHPFIPTLILNPIGFFVSLYILLNRRHLKVCKECRLRQTMGGQRGAQGALNRESHIQLKNFVLISGLMTLAVWCYYWFHYIDTNISDRDTYIFTWLTILVLLFDELYFCIRYYNLYLDFKEGNELIYSQQLRDMTEVTYIRFYVFCGEYLYISEHSKDPNISGKEVIDTPFFTKQTIEAQLGEDAKSVIEKMTGDKDGKLRFFYGRKNPDDGKQKLLRYFYFLEEEDGKLPELETKGEWMKFEKIKFLYSHYPSKLAELFVYDLTRLATIILTEKIFDTEGFRKSKIKTYNPTFDVDDIRNSDIDFQEDKWIEISEFNSDIPLFKLKRWFRNHFSKVSNR